MRHIFVWSEALDALDGVGLGVKIAEVSYSTEGEGFMLWEVEGPSMTLTLDIANQLFDDSEEWILVHMCAPKDVLETHSIYTVSEHDEIDRCSRINTLLLPWAKEVELENTKMRQYA